MRSSTLVVMLCISCATLSWAETGPPDRAKGGQAATAPKTSTEPAGKDESDGFWKWLRTGDKKRPDRAAVPDRIERPERIERVERVDRPERAGGGCCQ